MAKRTSDQNRAIYQRRQAAARAAGFDSYGEQRRLRAEAQKLVPGRSKRAVEARDRVARQAKEYAKGSAREPDLREEFADIIDEFDFTFDEDSWYDFLDELSPKAE